MHLNLELTGPSVLHCKEGPGRSVITGRSVRSTFHYKVGKPSLKLN